MQNKKRLKIPLHLIFITLLTGLVLSAGGCTKADATTETIKKTARPVRAIPLTSEPRVQKRVFPGQAQAAKEVQLAFRVGGPLVSFTGETGKWVEKGECIAQIDPRDFRIRVKTLEAALASSRARLDETILQFKRYENLIKENAAAKSAFDQVKATFKMAKARVDGDRENLEAAKNALKDTKLIAPFSGYIHDTLVENHETVSQGQAIVVLVDLAAIEVEIGIPENLVSQASEFSGFTCRFEALPTQSYSARFKEIAKKPGASGRTYPMTLILNSEDTTQVRPGMAGEVTLFIPNGADRVFHLPMESLFGDPQGNSGIWIFNPKTKTVEARRVTPGKLSDKGVAVTGKLNTGEWVVTAGVHSLTQGQTVRLLKEPSTTNIGKAM